MYDENRPIKGQRNIEGNEVLSMKKNKKITETSIEYNNLYKFSERRKKTISKLENAVIATNSTQMKKYVLEAFENPNSKKDIYIGILPTETIYKIKSDLTQIKKENVNNIFKDNIEYAVKINQDEIRHINKKETINIEDVLNFLNSLDEVLTKFDLVSYSKYNKKQNALRFEKDMSDGNHIAFTVVSNQKQTLRIQTLFWDKEDYKNKKRGIQLTPNEKNSLSKTSKTDSLSTSSINNSIPQNTKSVKNNTAINKQSMQNKENNALQQENIKKELHKRIQNALINKNSQGRTYLGDVSNKIADKVKSLFGFDVSDKRHVLADNDIRHMIKEHGNPILEKQKGQIAITTKDIEKIPDILANYNRIVQGNDNREGKTIRYIKKYSDNISYVVEVVPEKGRALKIKTMWKKPARVTNGQQPPNLTSKTKPNLGISTSNTSIAQNSQLVKNDDVRSMKKNTSNTAQNNNAKTTQQIRFAKKTAKPEGEVIDPGATNAQREGSYIEQEISKALCKKILILITS